MRPASRRALDRAAVLIACALGHPVALPGQMRPWLLEHRKQLVPDVDRTPYLRAHDLLADIDGDRDLDLFTAQGRLLVNLGRFRFVDATAVVLPAIGALPQAAADVDRDGDVDLLVLAPALELLLNSGSGLFSVAYGRLPPTPYDTVSVGDLDNDGDLDLCVTGQVQSWILRNDGRGGFLAGAIALPGWYRPVVQLIDADGDGDLDIIVLAFGAMATGAVYENRGGGAFVPLVSALPALPYPIAAAATDLDADADLDLVVGTRSGSTAPRRILRNDGRGRFTDATAAVVPPTLSAATYSVAAHDLDGDGDIDLVLGQDERGSEVLLNVGGRFVRGPGGDLGVLPLGQFVTGDIDGDGILDLRAEPAHFLLGSGRGTFGLLDPADIELEFALPVTTHDLTGDGDLDLLQAVPTSTGVRYGVQRNDGTGTFVPHSVVATLSGTSQAAAVGDVDGDGDSDVVVATATNLALCRNLGNGVFAAPAWMPGAGIGYPRRTFTVDVDRDGDRDVICVGTEGFLVFTNDGRGGFALAARVAESGVTSAEVFDGDGDGDADLFSSTQRRAAVHENRGGTLFDVTAQWLPQAPPAGGTGLPAVAANRRWLFWVIGQDVLVYGHDGRAFAARPELTTRIAGPALNAHLVRVGSWDGPGLAVSVARESRTLLLGFEAWRGFTDRTAYLLGLDNTYQIVRDAGDIDGDGDIDAIASRVSGPGPGDVWDHRVLRARACSLQAPFVAHVGWDYEIRITSDVAAVAVPILGVQQVTIPIPTLGVLRVDPATAIVLPPISLQWARIDALWGASLTLQVPNRPFLRGLPLLSQALLCTGVPSLRLTAAARDVIR